MRESQRINQFQNICFLFFSQRFDRVTMKVQICNQCGMQSSSIKEFNEHYQIHQSLLFQCEKCPKLFDTRNKLRWHVIRNHKGQVQCDECCKFFLVQLTWIDTKRMSMTSVLSLVKIVQNFFEQIT